MFNIIELKNKKLLTIKEAAFYIGIGVNTLRKIRQADGFPNEIHVGYQKIFFLREDIDKWIDNKKIK